MTRLNRWMCAHVAHSVRRARRGTTCGGCLYLAWRRGEATPALRPRITIGHVHHEGEACVAACLRVTG